MARKTSIRGPLGDFVDISILGDKELQRKLARLPLKVQKQAVQPPLNGLAKQAAADITAAMPVLTGHLKSKGMTVEPLRGRRRGHIGRLVRTPTREELGGTVSSGTKTDPKWYYPALVEYGHGDVPSFPYIRNTMAAKRNRYLVFLRRAIGKRLLKLAKKKA